MVRIKVLKIILCFVICWYATTIHCQTSIKKYRILSLGLPDDSKRNAINLIADKWNIEFYPIAGCLVSKELEDSVNQKNDSTYKLIAAKYGKYWQTSFDNEIEEEYLIERKIDELVKAQDFIKNKDILSPYPGAPFPMHAIDDNGNYIVSISTYNSTWEEQKLYKLKVNYKKRIVEILNDFTH